MARLLRDGHSTLRDMQSLRLRSAWLYYTHGYTQQQIADRLGLARTTVIRLLDEAVKRGEVQFSIIEGVDELVELGLRLEDRLGIDEAIVVPSEAGADATARAVGAALGTLLSDAVQDGMSIGVGWGRTLTASLATFRPSRRQGTKVISLLGGIVEVSAANPLEFSWRIASELGAECYLFPAPLLVDSAETRERLMDRCGLDRLEQLADRLDLAVVSVGDIGTSATSLSRALVTVAEQQELVDLGCVCDMLCHFLDADGRLVDHPLNQRVMAIELDKVARAGHKILATGGAARAPAILAAHRRIGCQTLVTDEEAARRLLELAP